MSEVSDPSTAIVTTRVDVGYGGHITVNVNLQSGLIYDVQVAAAHKQPFDLGYYRDRVSDFSLSIYLYFLRHYPLHQQPQQQQQLHQQPQQHHQQQQQQPQIASYAGQITDRATMIDCLKLSSLLIDDNFFEFLIQQLFKRWTLLSPVLYSSKVTDDTKYRIWLRCPQQLLPEQWLDIQSASTNNQTANQTADQEQEIERAAFQRLWLARTDNKRVTVNDNEILEYVERAGLSDDSDDSDDPDVAVDLNSTYTKTIVAYHNDKTKDLIATIQTTDYYRGEPTVYSVENYFNDRSHGPALTDEKEIRVVAKGSYIGGELAGQRLIYDSDVLVEDRYYVDNMRKGEERQYYSSGQLKEVITLNGGDMSRNVKTWHDDPDHTLKSEIKDSMNDGLVSANFYRLDGSYITTIIQPAVTLQLSVTALIFHSASGRITREISHPLDTSVTKRDIHFDALGRVTSDQVRQHELVYDVDSDEWIVSTPASSETLPFYG